MANFLTVLCALVAGAAAKPGVTAPFAAPLVAALFAGAAINAPLDAAYASSRLDIQQKYGAALFAAGPARIVSATPVAAPLAAPVAASLATAPAKVLAFPPVTAPPAYTNLPLDAAYASSRLDIHQNYGSAIFPAAYVAVPTKLVSPATVTASLATPVPNPLTTAPAKFAASAPVAVAAPIAYKNLPLDCAYASSRLDIQHNYGAALVLPSLRLHLRL